MLGGVSVNKTGDRSIGMKCLINRNGKYIHTQLCYRRGLWTTWEEDAKVFASKSAAERFASENGLLDYEIIPLQPTKPSTDQELSIDADS